MSLSRRRRLCVAALLCIALGACNAALDKAISTTEGTTGLTVSRSDTAVVVVNGAGRPMLNVRATIEGEEGRTFIHVLPTLEAGQKTDLRFADFRTEDGILFDPGVTRGKQIRVTARDTLANSYDVTSPWGR
jgi:hypothetical protein